MTPIESFILGLIVGGLVSYLGWVLGREIKNLKENKVLIVDQIRGNQ